MGYMVCLNGYAAMDTSWHRMLQIAYPTNERVPLSGRFAQISVFTLLIMGLHGLTLDNLCNRYISQYPGV
jgi:hypothetical protein